MKITILKMPNSSTRWHLVMKYLELRRKVFIEELQWELDGHEEFEHEQYDALPVAHYVVAHNERDEVLAGARLLRCDVELGDPKFDMVPGRFPGPTYSYMIRDATLGRIRLPRELMTSKAPTDKETWELTRLVSKATDAAPSVAVLRAAHEYIRLQGAKRCLCLGSPIIMRLAQKYGFNPVKEGPICSNKDGKFLVFSCPVS